jgi:glutathione S-transferase
MITLYQLHWSHYVEKVRWALDFKGVGWRAIDIDAFTKREMQHLSRKTTLDSGRQLYTVPTIHDDSTGAVVGESSEILSYLEQTYPTPPLYPDELTQRNEVVQWMVWLDSTLGLAARRLAYTQIALEYPRLLGQLFVPGLVGVKAWIAGAVIGGVLTRRFRFLHNRADEVYEQLETCLLLVGRRLDSRDYLVGDRFTAADLTLAALMRPVTVVPFFRNHPHLQRLFDWRDAQLRAHGRDQRIGYEVVLHEVRQRRGWAYGGVPWMSVTPPSGISTDPPFLTAVRNDQQSVGRWPGVQGLLWFLRLRMTRELKRDTELVYPKSAPSPEE